MLSSLSSHHQVQTRPFNFAPGPAALPESVLKRAAEEMLNWHGSNVSVMEMSHRSKEFTQIYENAVRAFRVLLALPDNFEILFLQGGGIGQNAIVPLNLSKGHKADFVVTGGWSQKSAQEAGKYCDVKVIADASAQDGGFYHIPEVGQWEIREDTQYVHICSNETVHGVEFQELPDLKALTGRDIPLVVDASSHILTRPVDWQRVGLLFAGAQKNIGPAGVTVVVIRNDLLDQALHQCPTAFNYQTVAKAHSAYNTPPVYAIYMVGLVLEWLKEQGGVAAMESNALLRSGMIYQMIDESAGFYRCLVQKAFRSRVNIPFLLEDTALEEAFVQDALKNRILNIKGHSSVGGMRASLYNAMPVQGAKVLADFMREFAQKNG